MTPEIWTVLGTGFTLAALGITGFTLLWRYITRAEQRTRADLAAAEQRTRADLATAEKRNEARFGELKSDLAAAEKRNEARFGELKSDLAAAEKRNESASSASAPACTRSRSRWPSWKVSSKDCARRSPVSALRDRRAASRPRPAVRGRCRLRNPPPNPGAAASGAAAPPPEILALRCGEFVVDGRDAPSRPGRKAHNCHLSCGAGGVSPDRAVASRRTRAAR